MKTKGNSLIVVVLLNAGFIFSQNPQISEDILNVLAKKNLIGQNEADSIRSEVAIKQQSVKEKQKIFSVNGKTPIQIGGYAQARFQSLQETGKPDGFDIRRARLTVDGNSSTWEYRVNADFAGAPKLIDAYIGYNVCDFLKITVGQFYVPFSLENVTQDRSLDLIDRSQVVTALSARDKDVIGNQNGRDIGLQLSGKVFKLNDRFIFDYYLAYLNGAGINTTDNNEAKDVSGRLVFHPIKGLDIGGSYYNGYDQWSAGSPAKVLSRNRLRTGGEVAYSFKNLSVRGEFIQGQDGSITTLNKEDKALIRKGYYAQVGYFVLPKKLQLVAKYDVYDPDTINDATQIKGSDADISTYYVFGATYYFSEWMKLQVNASFREEQFLQINNDVITAQFQVSF